MVYCGVTIGDSVFVGPHAVFTNDMKPRAHLWSDDRLEKTNVKNGVSIGANATIRCGITLGEWCMIAAGSVVTKNVPPHALMVGVPARILGWVTESGERLEVDVETGLKGGTFVCKVTGESVTLKQFEK